MSEFQEKITKEIKITKSIYNKKITNKPKHNFTISFLSFIINNPKQLNNYKNLKTYKENIQLFFKNRNISVFDYLIKYKLKNPKTIGINYTIGLYFENCINTKQNIEISKQYYNFQIQNSIVHGKVINNLNVILYNKEKFEEAIKTFKKGVEYGNKITERNFE